MSPMAAKRDYYEILGVARDAAPEDVKRAYRKSAAANHPDRNPGDEAAIERFKEAAEAFDVLGDADKRALYDRYGHEAFARAGGRQAGFNDVGDIFSAFGDMFEGLFGGQAGRGGGRRVTRGDSLRCTIELELRESAFGCTRAVEIERAELCATCDGSGAKPGSAAERCAYCAGRGQVVQAQGFFRIQTTCPACRGAGEIVREKCSKCSGSGRERKAVRLEVKVPAGVDNGMTTAAREATCIARSMSPSIRCLCVTDTIWCSPSPSAIRRQRWGPVSKFHCWMASTISKFPPAHSRATSSACAGKGCPTRTRAAREISWSRFTSRSPGK
jgi:molecular chaperone DnaJ